MIACDDPNCPIIWFHMECIGMEKDPEGEWICSVCKGLYILFLFYISYYTVIFKELF